jgi:flagellar hook-associated protein 1 FlgK
VAEDYINSAQLIHDQLSSRQQSISGVSLDEEMAQMIQYQHAYDAAARVLTVADEMLGTIIEQMGVH